MYKDFLKKRVQFNVVNRIQNNDTFSQKSNISGRNKGHTRSKDMKIR